jgi:hypothetical protein
MPPAVITQVVAAGRRLNRLTDEGRRGNSLAFGIADSPLSYPPGTFRLANVADSTIGTARGAHHVESPTEFRAVALLALAAAPAQIPAADVRERDGRLLAPGPATKPIVRQNNLFSATWTAMPTYWH